MKKPKKFALVLLWIPWLISIAGCVSTLPGTEVPGTLIPKTIATPSSTSSTEPESLASPISPTVTLTPALVSSATPLSPTVTPFVVCSPLVYETITELSEIASDPYKPPPSNQPEARHHGVDFSHYSRKGRKSIEGEPVLSILPGTIAASVKDRLPYGNMVIVETPYQAFPKDFAETLPLDEGQSLYVLYAHFRLPPQVNFGDIVTCGQVLGEVGAVGYNVVNAHLHLETRHGPPGVTFTSMAFYTTTASVEEMQNYQRWRTGGEFIHFDPMKFFQLYLDWLNSR